MAKNQDVVLDKALTSLGRSLQLYSVERDVLSVKRLDGEAHRAGDSR